MSVVLQRQFDYYNRRYFGNKLKRIPVHWYRKPQRRYKMTRKSWLDIAGRTYYRDGHPSQIWLHWKLRKCPNYAKIVLLHEMSHAALPYRIVHGPKFQQQMMKLAKKCAFKELW